MTEPRIITLTVALTYDEWKQLEKAAAQQDTAPREALRNLALDYAQLHAPLGRITPENAA